MVLLMFMAFTLFRGMYSDDIDVAQLAKIASVCHLCGSSVAYSHLRVALFGKKSKPDKTSIKDKHSIRYNIER